MNIHTRLVPNKGPTRTCCVMSGVGQTLSGFRSFSDTEIADKGTVVPVMSPVLFS